VVVVEGTEVTVDVIGTEALLVVAIIVIEDG
jgi:hypothetical protein